MTIFTSKEIELLIYLPSIIYIVYVVRPNCISAIVRMKVSRPSVFNDIGGTRRDCKDLCFVLWCVYDCLLHYMARDRHIRMQPGYETMGY